MGRVNSTEKAAKLGCDDVPSSSSLSILSQCTVTIIEQGISLTAHMQLSYDETPFSAVMVATIFHVKERDF